MGTTEDARARRHVPSWSDMREARRAHVGRVAGLMEKWAREMRLPAGERELWLTAAWSHDALRDADPAALRARLDPPFDRLPDPLLHGPAAAERLAREGLPERVVDAVRYHTTGHPSFDRLGEALYLADFLEPGRPFRQEENERLRQRLPEDWDAVLKEVLAHRLGHQLERFMPVVQWSWRWWNRMNCADEDVWPG